MMRALILLCGFGSVSVAADAPLPRYDLTPGRVIEFSMNSVFKHQSGEHHDEADSTCWVLKTNPDGSARLLIRTVSRFKAIYGNQIKVKQNGKEVSEQVSPPTTSLAYADIFPDGRILPNPSIEMRGRPDKLFPRLPATSEEWKAGWTGASGDSTITAKPTPEGEFTVDTVGPMDKIYESTARITYRFDPKEKLIASAKTESTQNYGFKGKSTGSLKQVSVKPITAAELATLMGDSERFFAATAAYDAALETADALAPDLAKAQLDKAVAALKKVESTITQPQLKKTVAGYIKAHDGRAKYRLDDLARRAKFVGKPAFEFDAKTLADRPTKLADYKGKVVVLDFWYRGCGWCIKAMPQMNELATDFQTEPVAILGMNTDTKKADAEFVVKEMALKYPTVCIDREIPGKYGVQGFPTLIIIDQEGVVRDMHVGYTPKLREQVGQKIRELLRESK